MDFKVSAALIRRGARPEVLNKKLNTLMLWHGSEKPSDLMETACASMILSAGETHPELDDGRVTVHFVVVLNNLLLACLADIEEGLYMLPSAVVNAGSITSESLEALLTTMIPALALTNFCTQPLIFSTGTDGHYTFLIVLNAVHNINLDDQTGLMCLIPLDCANKRNFCDGDKVVFGERQQEGTTIEVHGLTIYPRKATGLIFGIPFSEIGLRADQKAPCGMHGSFDHSLMMSTFDLEDSNELWWTTDRFTFGENLSMSQSWVKLSVFRGRDQGQVMALKNKYLTEKVQEMIKAYREKVNTSGFFEKKVAKTIGSNGAGAVSSDMVREARYLCDKDVLKIIMGSLRQ